MKEDRYRRIFCEGYNIGFKFPKSDICVTCDELHIVNNSAGSAGTDLTVKGNAELLQKELHLRYAESIRQKMTEYTEIAISNPEDVHVITVDLQQTLPTPKLTVGHAFYCRKLWTYNVGIHNCATDAAYMSIAKATKIKIKNTCEGYMYDIKS